MTDERDNPGIRAPPPLIYLGALVLGLLLDRRRHLPFLPGGVARGLGFSLLGGAVLNGWFLRTIRKTDVPIRTDKPVPRLTTEGPFRYSRNPSYLALAMIYAGMASLRNSLWAMLLLPLVVMVIQREVIGREERNLEHTFGEEYLALRHGFGAGYSRCNFHEKVHFVEADAVVLSRSSVTTPSPSPYVCHIQTKMRPLMPVAYNANHSLACWRASQYPGRATRWH